MMQCDRPESAISSHCPIAGERLLNTYSVEKLGPLTALSPTDEEASTERTVLTSTLEGEDIEGTAPLTVEIAC